MAAKDFQNLNVYQFGAITTTKYDKARSSTICNFTAQKAEAWNPSAVGVVPLCLQGKTTLTLPRLWRSAGNTWSSFDCGFRTESLQLYHVAFSSHGSTSLCPFVFINTLMILDLGPSATVVTIQQQCTSFQIESLYRVLRIWLERPFVGRKKINHTSGIPSCIFTVFKWTIHQNSGCRLIGSKDISPFFWVSSTTANP